MGPLERLVCHGGVDTPCAELPFGRADVFAKLEQGQGQTTSFVLGLLAGRIELRLLPVGVGSLNWPGEPLELTLGDVGHAASDAELVITVAPGHAELAGAIDGSHERGVAPILHAQAERGCRVDEVKVEAIRLEVQTVSQPPQEPRRRRPKDAEPVLLDIAGSWVMSEAIDDRVEPRQYPNLWRQRGPRQQ